MPKWKGSGFPGAPQRVPLPPADSRPFFLAFALAASFWALALTSAADLAFAALSACARVAIVFVRALAAARAGRAPGLRGGPPRRCLR